MSHAVYIRADDADGIVAAAQRLIAEAARIGLVVTIEQRPLQPLAMGHHETVATVRPARGQQ